MPSLDIAVFTVSRCLYICHLCGPSGMPAIIVVIFERCLPEHGAIVENAGLTVRAEAAIAAAAMMIPYFILHLP